MIRRARFGSGARRRTDRAIHFGLGVAIVLCLGCAGPPPPADHFYRLTVAPPPRLARMPLAGRLEVERVRAAAIGQGRRIAYRAADEANEIGLYSYHHWVDPLPTMIQGALGRVLWEAGIAPEVSVPALHLEPDYVLYGRVVAFERLVGEVTSAGLVEIEFSLVREADHSLVLQRTYREEVEAETSTVLATVEALSSALSRVVANLVRDLSEN